MSFDAEDNAELNVTFSKVDSDRTAKSEKMTPSN